MKNSIYYFLFLLLCCLVMVPTYAQPYNASQGYLKANSKWVFGANIGWNKANNSLFPVTGFNASGASLSVADSATGQLLFYSNGVNCWSANGQLMPNGQGIGGIGTGGRTQPVCAVPFIAAPGKYYLFALTDPFSATGFSNDGKGKLFYSVLDMSLNNGLGDIVPGQKAILLDSLLGSSIIAIPGNNCDVWLMAHALYSSTYKAFHITAAGLDLNPVSSTSGPAVYQTPIVLGADTWRQGYTQGQMSVSPDRSKIAYGVISLNGIPLPAGVTPLGFIVSKFNPDNGIVSETLQFNAGNIHVYGIGFSPDNTKLYVNVVASDNNVVNGIIQYDISNYNATAIANSAFPIFTAPAGSIKQKYIKLYNDTLYLSNQSTGGVPSLSVITAPNLAGALSNYQQAAISLTGSLVQGISNDMVFPLPPETNYATLLDTTICKHFNPFIISAPPGRTAYEWNNGVTNQQQIINALGTYWVKSKSGCTVYIDTFRVTGINALDVDLGKDTLVCNQDSFLLHPAVPEGATFLWQDGSTADRLRVSQSGSYALAVTLNGCTDRDTISVTFSDLRQDLGADNIACKGVPVAVQAQVNGAQGASILWSTGSTGRSLWIDEPGTYWVTLREGSCQASDTLKVIRELCDCQVAIPNAFSPNGDGRNDIFLPVVEAGCVLTAYELAIYNRWGQLVFYNYGSQVGGWDGYADGQSCDAGVYFYTLKLKKGTRQLSFEKKGDLMLLR